MADAQVEKESTGSHIFSANHAMIDEFSKSLKSCGTTDDIQTKLCDDISLPCMNCSDISQPNSQESISEINLIAYKETLSACKRTIKDINEREASTVQVAEVQNVDCCIQQPENSNTEVDETRQIETPVEGKDKSSSGCHRYQVNFNETPLQITGSWQDFEELPQNFLKGCKWSPDGLCILTCSDDNMLRIFNLPTELYSDFQNCNVLPEMSPVLEMREGETVYDYSWYPNMSSCNPSTCCFISSSRDHPVHLWDAFTGQIRCSYRAYNPMDEVVSPHCTTFNLDGTKIYCGFNKMVRVFDTLRPGRHCQQRPTVSKKEGQFGIISCIAVSPENNGLYACGSFSKSVGIYGEPKGNLLSLVEGHQGGVTHLIFSPDGHRLYSGGRKDNEIICWDMRYPGAFLHKLTRCVNTNQRMYFDIDSSGRYLISGNHNGIVSVWDTVASSDVILPCLTYIAHNDCVNGISIHPWLPLLATASGQRTFILQDESENDGDEELRPDNSMRLWKLQYITEET